MAASDKFTFFVEWTPMHVCLDDTSSQYIVHVHVYWTDSDRTLKILNVPQPHDSIYLLYRYIHVRLYLHSRIISVMDTVIKLPVLYMYVFTHALVG